MKIVVSSQPPGGLDVLVDPRFGRCASFTICEVEGNSVTNVNVIPNTAAESFSGAGIQAAQLVANSGATIVLTGNVGPNAFTALQQLGIQIFTGVFGVTVQAAIESYLTGTLTSTAGPTTGAKSGMGGGGRG
ncbi:MAG: NifB/NifX family molybdenum-iron cluster-binding protein, partial [Promethearchaeota archaeon]